MRAILGILGVDHALIPEELTVVSCDLGSCDLIADCATSARLLGTGQPLLIPEQLTASHVVESIVAEGRTGRG